MEFSRHGFSLMNTDLDPHLSVKICGYNSRTPLTAWPPTDFARSTAFELY